MKLGVMCSGNGSNFENVVRTCREDEVVLMIHNKEKCGAAKRAEKLGIPHLHIKSKDEDLIIKTFKAMEVDFIVLAGWMRILSPSFINSFPHQIINIHPSLLPKYKGLNAVKQALESNDTVTGCTVHYVTVDLDACEIIMQEEVCILPYDTEGSLTKVIHQAEHKIMTKTLKKLNNVSE